MSMPPDALRFPCPACGVTLTVPASVAGLQGPCPQCWQEIVSPDPSRGLQAHLPAPVKLTTPEPPAPPVPLSPPPSRSASPPPEEEFSPPPSVPPLPKKHPSPTPAAPRKRTGLWVGGGLALAALLAGGYYFGSRMSYVFGFEVPSAPVNYTYTPPPAETPAPNPEPVRAAPPKPTGKPAADAEAVLVAFLSAPDWKARSAFVLHPDNVRPAMEEHARENGDGPISVSSITLLEEALPNILFKLCTPGIPEGFPVPVTLTDEGPRIDWEGFIGFHDDHFRKLTTGPTGQTGILDLFVKPEPEDAANPHFASFRLSVPMPGRESSAWVRRDTVTYARLKAIFDGSDDIDPAAVQRLVADSGVPLRLAVTKKSTSSGQEFLEISDMVAVYWSRPANP